MTSRVIGLLAVVLLLVVACSGDGAAPQSAPAQVAPRASAAAPATAVPSSRT